MGNLQESQYSALLSRFQMHGNDTGSSMCQIIRLTEKIKGVAENHLKMHKKDHPAKRSVVRWVAERRRLQRYLLKKNKKNLSQYNELMAAIGLRGG